MDVLTTCIGAKSAEFVYDLDILIAWGRIQLSCLTSSSRSTGKKCCKFLDSKFRSLGKMLKKKSSTTAFFRNASCPIAKPINQAVLWGDKSASNVSIKCKAMHTVAKKNLATYAVLGQS